MKRVCVELTGRQVERLQVAVMSGLCKKEFDNCQRIRPVEQRAVDILEDAVDAASDDEVVELIRRHLAKLEIARTGCISHNGLGRIMKKVHLDLTVPQAMALRILASSGWSEKEFDDAQRLEPVEHRAMILLEDAIEKTTGKQFAHRMSARQQ